MKLDLVILQTKIKELIPEEYSFVNDFEFGELETHKNPLTGNVFVFINNIALFEDETGEISEYINDFNKLNVEDKKDNNGFEIIDDEEQQIIIDIFGEI
jgi:hypothetical protein